MTRCPGSASRPFDSADIKLATTVLDRYQDLQIGLADASLVVLAERHQVAEVLTLDERHFRALRYEKRKRFKLLPIER